MSLIRHDCIRLSRLSLTRRSFLQDVSTASIAAGTLGWRDRLSVQAEEFRRQGRSMILLWMAGGPSQFETFDPKPGTPNGGPTTALRTAVGGIQVAKGWERTAQVMNDLAIIRSMSNKEGNHQRATYQMHTGYLPSGSVKHPSLGSNIARERSDAMFDLPAVVSIGRTVGAGFLGIDYEPFNIQDPSSMPQNVATGVSTGRYQRRLGLLDRLETDFAARGGKVVVDNHRRLYGKAARMALSKELKTFDITAEPASLRERYGENNFGRGCLLARRLVEAGVTFVEVRSDGWDTHQDNFERTGNLAAQIDPALATLITDLKARGRLASTLVVWLGEFGRTPGINPRTGRDHYPRVFSAVMAGGGVHGGQVVGASTPDGTAVAERPVTVADLFCSICKSLAVNPRRENISPLGRPMKIVDGGQVVDELFA